jgi:ribosomal protein L16 Arg81 hydroxylase
MISYAATGGSVGPHFDYYDVFLLQGKGKRRWHLSRQDCELSNYLEDAPLRIMNKFNAEQVFDVEPGDILCLASSSWFNELTFRLLQKSINALLLIPLNLISSPLTNT